MDPNLHILELYSFNKRFQHTHTWHTHGFYDYAHTRIVLEAPEGSEKRIGMTCEDAGEGVADCKMVRESDGFQCGHATLLREV